MRVTRISAAIELRRSDGDYGSDLAKVEGVADLEPGDDPIGCFENLLGQLRTHAERDLSQSTALKVRRAMIVQVRRCARCNEPLADDETSYMHEACKAAEAAEREARYQERRAAIAREEDEETQFAEAALARAEGGEDLGIPDNGEHPERGPDRELAGNVADGAEDKPF